MSGYRAPYTMAEEKKILRYIIDNDQFYKVRGRELWEKMENEKVVERTWQSMKEHFRKHILYTLNNQHFELTQQEIELLRLGFSHTQVEKRSTPVNRTSMSTSKTAKPSHNKQVDLSDIVDISSDEDDNV